MWSSVVYFVSLICIPIGILCVESDYFWREYTGLIPSDAISAGKNIDGQKVYIGQAYVKDAGLMVAQINPGCKQVAAPLDGVKIVSQYIKILCGPQNNFYWTYTNSSILHLTLLDHEGVLGGHEDAFGHIHIGRISYNGGDQVGKINSFSVGSAHFRYADVYGKEPVVHSYEVLTYLQNKF